MKTSTQPGAIAGRYEIGKMFKVTRQGVASIISHPDFPAPICEQGKNKAPLFWTRDVEAFKAERDREQATAAETPAAA